MVSVCENMTEQVRVSVLGVGSYELLVESGHTVDNRSRHVVQPFGEDATVQSSEVVDISELGSLSE